MDTQQARAKVHTMANCNYQVPTMLYEQPTLADHAEMWAQGKVLIPERNTPEWDALYQAWVDFAFADFSQ